MLVKFALPGAPTIGFCSAEGCLRVYRDTDLIDRTKGIAMLVALQAIDERRVSAGRAWVASWARARVVR